jgi:hypothetical protein
MKISTYQFIKFILINVFIKVIPLLIIINDKITSFDIIISLILFIIYLLWLFINNINLMDIYKKINKSYMNIDNIDNIDKEKTYFSNFFDFIFSKI